MKIMSWTDEQVEQLKALWEQGLPCSKIAKEMDAPSRNAIIGKASRLGLAGRREGVNPLAAAERAERPPRPAPKPRQLRPAPAFNGHVRLALSPPISRGTTMNGLNLAGAKDRGQKPLEDLPPEVSANPVALFDLQDHHCRWPLGVPHHEMLHCGAQVEVGRSYCPAHCRMAYQPAPGRLRPPYGASNPRAKQEMEEKRVAT